MRCALALLMWCGVAHADECVLANGAYAEPALLVGGSTGKYEESTVVAAIRSSIGIYFSACSGGSRGMHLGGTLDAGSPELAGIGLGVELEIVPLAIGAVALGGRFGVTETVLDRKSGPETYSIGPRLRTGIWVLGIDAQYSTGYSSTSRTSMGVVETRTPIESVVAVVGVSSQPTAIADLVLTSLGLVVVGIAGFATSSGN